jgi:hypothetical protein
MQMKSKSRLMFVWLACFAILLNALVPSISHAVALAKGKPRVWEICLNDGSRISGTGELTATAFNALTNRSDPQAAARAQAKARVEASQANAGMTMNMSDCGYCMTHAGSTGLPPSDFALVLPAAEPSLRPALFYHSPQPLQVWSTANPRGPPARS